MAIRKVASNSLDIDKIVGEYDSLRGEKKIIDDRMKILSAQIKDYAEQYGSKDDKGSSYFKTNNGYNIGKVAKKSVSFNEDKAIKYLSDHDYKDCIDYKPVINESAVESRIESGDISFEDLEGITVTKTSFSVDVKKTDMPVVEQSEVKFAASEKPKSVLKAKR